MVKPSLVALIATTVCATAPGQDQRSDGAAAELRRLHGKWQVSSAAFQTVGPIFYTFDTETLTIEQHAYGTKKDSKIPDSPPSGGGQRYRCRLNVNRDPKQIILSFMNDEQGTGKQFVYIYEFREGRLWMCPDDGPTPKNRTSLQHGKSGSGWLVGLDPVK